MMHGQTKIKCNYALIWVGTHGLESRNVYSFNPSGV